MPYLSFYTGYGDVVVESDFGKIFLLFFAILGIPLHMYTSYLVGKVITWTLKNLLYLIEFRILQRMAIRYEAAKVLFMSLLLSILWMLFCSFLIVNQKNNWSVVDALYFSLVSMSTIGFGDLTLEIFTLRPVHIYLNWHIYVGTSLLASVVNGILEFLKRPHGTGEYKLSNRNCSISVIGIDLRGNKNSLELCSSDLENGDGGTGLRQSTNNSRIIKNNSITSNL